MYIEQIQHNCLQLRKEINQLTSQIANFPDGELFIRRNGKYFKYYYKVNSSVTYLSHKDTNLIHELALKKVLTEKRKELSLELSLSEQLTKNYHKKALKAGIGFHSDNPFFQILSSANTEIGNDILNWSQSAYETNPLFPEQKKYLSPSGNKVRSKSELLIDIALFSHQIPFRYECALALGGTNIYPDFTIKHPHTGEIYYWEHFGLMDDIDYKSKAGKKIANYISHKIYPSVQLITTFESEAIPFTPSVIEETIQYYFV